MKGADPCVECDNGKITSGTGATDVSNCNIGMSLSVCQSLLCRTMAMYPIVLLVCVFTLSEYAAC